jgi:hypothetical protein
VPLIGFGQVVPPLGLLPELFRLMLVERRQ